MFVCAMGERERESQHTQAISDIKIQSEQSLAEEGRGRLPSRGDVPQEKIPGEDTRGDVPLTPEEALKERVQKKSTETESQAHPVYDLHLALEKQQARSQNLLQENERLRADIERLSAENEELVEREERRKEKDRQRMANKRQANPEEYKAYQREYMRKYRAQKKQQPES